MQVAPKSAKHRYLPEPRGDPAAIAVKAPDQVGGEEEGEHVGPHVGPGEDGHGRKDQDLHLEEGGGPVAADRGLDQPERKARHGGFDKD